MPGACESREVTEPQRDQILSGFELKKQLNNRDVAQLVARLVWDQDVAGSNPVIPTNSGIHKAFEYQKRGFDRKSKPQGDTLRLF